MDSDAAVGQRRFRPYPEYTDSGAEWLGEIPAHWGTKRLKYLTSANDEVLREDTDPNLEISYVDIGSVDSTAGITKREQLVFETAPSRARRIVRDGDVIVSTVRTYLRAIATIEQPEPNFIVSTGFAVIRPRHLDSSFAGYALRAPYFVERVVANSVGVSYPAITASELNCIPITYPELTEQRAIAAFLDRETARIDVLVAKKGRLIELLQEKRTALITRAVTKGLDPNAPMKDSGVEWLGDIPAHWEGKRLPRITSVQEGPGIMAADFRDEGVPLLRIANLQSNAVQLDGCNFLDRAAVERRWRRFQLRTGDLLISGSASMGLVSVVGEDTEGSVPYTGIFRLQPVSSETRHDYLRYFLASEVFLDQVNTLKTGVGIQHYGPTHLRRVWAPVPPIDEQVEIGRCLDEETGRIDVLVGKIRDSTDRLKELRIALISAAVTGKIDVRGEAA